MTPWLSGLDKTEKDSELSDVCIAILTDICITVVIHSANSPNEFPL